MVIWRAMQPVVSSEARGRAMIRHGPASHPFAFAAFADAPAGELYIITNPIRSTHGASSCSISSLQRTRGVRLSRRHSYLDPRPSDQLGDTDDRARGAR